MHHSNGRKADGDQLLRRLDDLIAAALVREYRPLFRSAGRHLHILKGDVPSVTAGRILGHEGVGVVEAIGSGVSSFHPGDLVLISCITACGICDFCRKGMRSHCRTGGWILGHTIDGTQAEYVRIPTRTRACTRSRAIWMSKPSCC